MLEQAPPYAGMDAAIQRYLHETLGLHAHLRHWKSAGKLPYFLQDKFEVRQLTLLGRDLLFAVDLRRKRQKLSDLRVFVEKLRAVAQLPVIYVTNTLASYERKRLVEQRVPFLVPGNQLYLPDLGIDLREYFRHPKIEGGKPVSPATQAVLIKMLLSKPWRNDWVLADVVTQLGYTPMTSTRVLRELAAQGLAETNRRGRERQLHTDARPQVFWERTRKNMRSPVKRSVWITVTKKEELDLRLAGLSALAHVTKLADPPWPIYAVGPTEWRKVKQAKTEVLPQPTEGYAEWQLWTYSPTLVSNSRTVDPLSLILSLEQTADERVQMALDELGKHLPW